MRMGTKENDDGARGKYEAVVDSSPGPKRPSSFLRGLVTLGPLPALLLVAVALMLTHHFFYTYLDEKSIDRVAAELPPLLRNQNNVDFIGTTIAHAARIVLSMAICSIFAQLFWETLRSRGHTIRQIDALVNCGQSPFGQSGLRAAAISFLLFAISFVASATALVVVFAPGSLTVSPGIERQSICAVPSVPHNDSLMGASTIPTQLEGFNSYILALNSYLPPFQTSPSSTCGYATCSYNISFVGPELSCSDITNETDFSSFLNPKNAPSAAPFQIWNATVFGTFGTRYGITIFSRDLLKGSLQATNCTINSATYDAVVTLADDTSSVQVWNTTPTSYIAVVDTTFISPYTHSGLSALTTNLFAGPNGYTTYLAGTLFPIINLQSSPFFVTTPTGNHTFSDSPARFAEAFFQNMSISLLSGSVYYGISNDTATNLEMIETTCSSLVTVYVYDSSRLLFAYGAMLGIGAVVVAYGCWLISRNGPEKRLIFSDVIRIGLNDEMMSLSGKLAGQCKVQLQRTGRVPGRLILLSPVEDKLRQSSFAGAPHSTISPWILPRFVTAFPWKMVVLILATFCCMALNHAYYHYLDGKAPVTAIDSSNWLQNQSAVSDIGIALAYVCQVFLASAITSSCVQLFWRAIRSRGIAISQVDALMEIQAVSFPPSMFRALCASWTVPLLSLLAASTSLLSIFAPGSIKVSPNRSHTETCTVLSPRNLSELKTTFTDYSTPINTGMLSGTYLQPAIPFPGSQYSYDLEFVGPGFDCQDATQSNTFAEFNASSAALFPGVLPLFVADFIDQTDDLTMVLRVRTWDVKRSLYQAANCTGVSRSYSISVSSGTTALGSSISVRESRLLAPVLTNVSQVSSFTDAFLYATMSLLTDRVTFISPSGDYVMGVVYVSPVDSADLLPFSLGSAIARFELDNSLSIAENLTQALEEYAQNSTLSILSDTVFAVNSDDPNLLENVTTTCTYQSTAYEYFKYRLFVTYGVAIFITILCVIWGTIAVKRNGVEESINFSRILQAILNEGMFSARDDWDENTVIKANDTEEGSLVPWDSQSWH